MSYCSTGKMTLTNDEGKEFHYDVECMGNSMYLKNDTEYWHLVGTEKRTMARIQEKIDGLEYKTKQLKDTVKQMRAYQRKKQNANKS